MQTLKITGSFQNVLMPYGRAVVWNRLLPTLYNGIHHPYRNVPSGQPLGVPQTSPTNCVTTIVPLVRQLDSADNYALGRETTKPVASGPP